MKWALFYYRVQVKKPLQRFKQNVYNILSRFILKLKRKYTNLSILIEIYLQEIFFPVYLVGISFFEFLSNQRSF